MNNNYEIQQIKKRIRGIFLSPFMQISPEIATKMTYFLKFKKRLNLKNPIDFNEKIQWLKLNYQIESILVASDKVKVEQILVEKNLSEYLIKRIGVFHSVKEIDWNQLPNQFVIKTNNASGTNIIIHDKKEVKINRIEKQLKKWLRINFSNYALEPQYQEMEPLILVEELIKTTEPLKDYRFFCFNGKVEFLYVSIDGEINSEGFSDKKVRKGYFDLNFNKLDFLKVNTTEFDNVKKPNNFFQMIKIAEILSEKIPFVRVDLYNVNGQIYFGEMTFTPSSGFTDYYKDEVLLELGEKIELPRKKVKGYK